jgi:serine/threonine protein kinase
MEPGFIVDDKYKILEKVGKGAYATCYKAEMISDAVTEDGEETPLYVLKVAQTPEISLFEEFNVSQEACRHDRLLKYIEHGSVKIGNEFEGDLKSHEFLVSEFMVNGNMFKFVRNDGFDEDCARFLFRNILQGLEFFHKSGYAHLDIKLGNMLLDENYFPKLADFGFAQRIPIDDTFNSNEFKLTGTKHYICPEITEDTTFNGQAADVFALGVSFFVLLVGDYPFNSASKSDPKYKNMYKKDPNVFWRKHSRAKKKINKGLLSDNFMDLISRMLKPCKDDRIKIHEIKEHPWYTSSDMSPIKVQSYFDSIMSMEAIKCK